MGINNGTLTTIARGDIHIQIPALIGGRMLSPMQRAGLARPDPFFVFGYSSVGGNGIGTNLELPPTRLAPPVYPAYVPVVPPWAMPRNQMA